MTDYAWWSTQAKPDTQRARETVHWFLYGERIHATLSRLYRELLNKGFTEDTKRWIR